MILAAQEAEPGGSEKNAGPVFQGELKASLGNLNLSQNTKEKGLWFCGRALACMHMAVSSILITEVNRG